MSPTSHQLSIDTPELIDIEMPLAGIGSRFVAITIDYLLWVACYFLLLFAIALFIPSASRFHHITTKWFEALLVLSIFLLQWGYFSLFEALWNGRTPGKRIVKIRVIQRSGRAIGMLESLTRNFLRAIDWLPGFYAVGIVSIFFTRNHQRLGDMAAGTLVIRDREEEVPLWSNSGSRTFTASLYEPTPEVIRRPDPHTGIGLPADQVARLTVADLEVLEGFFSRRLDVSMETRALLASRIAAAIVAKSGSTGLPPGNVEDHLEAIARQLRQTARFQR